MKRQIKIGVGDAISTAKGFVDAWKRAAPCSAFISYTALLHGGWLSDRQQHRVPRSLDRHRA